MEKLSLIENKKKEIEKLNKEISQAKKLDEKLEKSKKILEINNTDTKLVQNHLILFIRIHKNDLNTFIIKNELEAYINHIPKKEFNDNFSKYYTKEKSSIEKLNSLIHKILEENWIFANYDTRKNAILFFYKNVRENIKEIEYTSPITWENSELYIDSLLKSFTQQINKKMEYYKEIQSDINTDAIKKQDNAINRMKKRLYELDDNSTPLKKYLIQIINELEENRKIISLIEGNFFEEYLFNFNKFLIVLKDSFLKSFTNNYFFDFKENQQIFEYFMLFISHYNFEKIDKETINVWKYSFTDLNYKQKINIIEAINKKQSDIEFILKEEKENKLLINIKNKNKKFEIENINDYELEGLCNSIYNKDNFNKYFFIKYVKIPKIYNHLFISDIINEWISFNNCIFNSKVIKSLFSTLFEKQNDYILDENELSIIIENINYFTFETDFQGLTMRKTLKIYEFGGLNELENEDLSKLIFLAFCLDINEHEVLGHFNIGYQKYDYNNKNINYKSPIINKELSTEYGKERDGQESGEDVEIKLYGRVIYSITLKEAFFILNLSNYNTDYSTFRKNFEKCNENKLIIDDSIKILLLDVLKVNPKNIPQNSNKVYYLDKNNKKFYSKNSYKIQGKHPSGFNIDGKYSKKKEKQIEKQINNLNKLEYDYESDYNSLLNSLNKNK